MHKFLLLLSVLVFTACSCVPAATADALTYERTDGNQITIWARIGSELVVSSTESITAFEPKDVCFRQTIGAGEDLSFWCTAPVTVRFETSGTVAAQIYDGYIAMTLPVVIPK